MNVHLDFLDFEQPIAGIESEIMTLRQTRDSDYEQQNIDNDLNLDRIKRLRLKSDKLTQKIYHNLKPWDIVKVARHPARPYASDYISRIVSNFTELHGDRNFGDDKAMICGLGKIGKQSVAIICQEKGRTTEQKIKRNFGMARPEGYRKAMRIMRLAERFQLPVISLIDTPGAYPNIDSEERGISNAIAENLALMSKLRTPIVCVIIGEGSSGGALGIGVGDYVGMMQYATYFVISPEGCANIIWKNSDNAAKAAEAMGVTAEILSKMKIIDDIIDEPLGGAHRDYDKAASALSDYIKNTLEKLKTYDHSTLLSRRYKRLLQYGNYHQDKTEFTG